MNTTINNHKIQVRFLAKGDEPRWDRFVAACAEATFFHRSGWKTVLESAFNHQSYFLLAEIADQIVGILPLARIQSRVFGDSLISTPFCVYGGAVCSDAGARQILESRAIRLAEDLGVDYLELRSRVPLQPNWLGKDLYCTFRKAIHVDPDANLVAIPRKQRALVRRAIQHGLTGTIDQDVSELCYDIYSESVRNLGTPVFSRRYFRLLKEVFGDDCDALLINYNGKAVAAVLNFYFKDEVLPYYGGGTAAARQLGATHFMYWDLMTRAAAKGVRLFDFGRSKQGSGSFEFKKYFGFTPEPLYYGYHLVKSREMPNVSPMNPKFRYFIQMWKSLPLGVSRMIGPWIAKNLG